MVETGRRLELDEEETLLALGVETSAGTGSVENLEIYLEHSVAMRYELS